jgi:hypothetical protein
MIVSLRCELKRHHRTVIVILGLLLLLASSTDARSQRGSADLPSEAPAPPPRRPSLGVPNAPPPWRPRPPPQRLYEVRCQTDYGWCSWVQRVPRREGAYCECLDGPYVDPGYVF